MTKSKRNEKRYHECEQVMNELQKLRLRLMAINALTTTLNDDLDKLKKDLVDELFTAK